MILAEQLPRTSSAHPDSVASEIEDEARAASVRLRSELDLITDLHRIGVP
jgi:hypothetical protein